MSYSEGSSYKGFVGIDLINFKSELNEKNNFLIFGCA